MLDRLEQPTTEYEHNHYIMIA